MAFIRLNDNVLVKEYCEFGEENCPINPSLAFCYNNNTNCRYWKREFKKLYEVLEEQENVQPKSRLEKE